MNNEFFLRHKFENGFDDCRIVVIHDILVEWGRYAQKAKDINDSTIQEALLVLVL